MKEELLIRTCDVDDVLTKAITIRLFDKSTWTNLGNGLFLKVGTEERTKKPIRLLYPQIRAVTWNHSVIAKRIKPKEDLKFLKEPKKF